MRYNINDILKNIGNSFVGKYVCEEICMHHYFRYRKQYWVMCLDAKNYYYYIIYYIIL